MTPKHWLRAAATAAVFAGILFAGVVISSTRARADGQDDENSKIQIGFEIRLLTQLSGGSSFNARNQLGQ